ncbi:MAG: DUF1643 domain-containing protein [Bacillota bacterium]|nr:DUF1643 domain-containing protein [Bacillota bacterium]
MWFEQVAISNQLSFETDTYNNILGNAVFNPNRTRRYFLEKRWAKGENILTAIMMNPSKAAHNQTDETVDQIIDVAKSQGCHALYVVNVSSIIDGSSNNLRDSHFAFEEINWTFISEAMEKAKIVFISWGLKGQQGIQEYQVNAFEKILSKLYCYEVVKSDNKKFTNKPMYYVPHPRPRYEQEKYRNEPIRQITELEFVQLFFR